MKFIIVLFSVLFFCVILNAQEKGNENFFAGSQEKILKQEKENAAEAGAFIPDIRKQKSDMLSVNSLQVIKNKEINDSKICYDDICSVDPESSCSSKTLLWGAITLIVGLMAFTGVKGK